MKIFSLQNLRQPSYERAIYLFLSSFRFFTFALAVALIFTIPREPPLEWRMLLIVSAVGVYTIIKVLFELHPWQSNLTTYAVMGVDLTICLALIQLTGGADSPFLLYSLLPTITGAIFLEPAPAFIITTLSCLNVILAHTVLTTINPSFSYILEGNYLNIILLYCICTLLITAITYRTNLNVYRHIKSDAITEERRSLKHEVHDNVAQSLGYLRLKLSLLKNSPPPAKKLLAEFMEIDKITAETYQDLRQVIDSLEGETKDISLIPSLTSYIEQVSKRMNTRVEFTVAEKVRPLHPLVQLQLLRIAQEALNNVRKHAQATKVTVRLDNTPSEGVELVVRDDGRGFSVQEQKGNGLRIMEERANSINGRLILTSSPGEGTEVRVKVAAG